MFRTLKDFNSYRDWRKYCFVGVLTIAAALAIAEAVYIFPVPPKSILFAFIAVAGVLGVSLVWSM